MYMYLVVFKVEVRNHLQMVLGECVTLPHMTRFHFTFSNQQSHD